MIRKKKYFSKFIFSLLLVFVLFSCTTIADYDFSRINDNIRICNYRGVYEEIDSCSKSLYSKKDKVVEALDRATLLHYMGDFESSNKEFSQAQTLIQKYKPASIVQSVTSFLKNDNTKDYRGETYEDIYINVFMALNYIHLGKIEDAFVEIRRFDNKLKVAALEYQAFIEKAKQDENITKDAIKEIDMEFHNSALARYLSMLLYLSVKDRESANIDKKYLEQAFSLQPNIYDFPEPSVVLQDIEDIGQNARLDVISFIGLAPVKLEQRLDIPIGDVFTQIALPVMKNVGSNVSKIEVLVTNTQTKEQKEFSLSLLESIENVAVNTFEQRRSILYTKAVTRAMTKSIMGNVLSYMADSDASQNGIAALFSLYSVATERADVRTSRFFPAKSCVGGITVPSGNYRVEITYRNKAGTVLQKASKDITLQKGQRAIQEYVFLM